MPKRERLTRAELTPDDLASASAAVNAPPGTSDVALSGKFRALAAAARLASPAPFDFRDVLLLRDGNCVTLDFDTAELAEAAFNWLADNAPIMLARPLP